MGHFIESFLFSTIQAVFCHPVERKFRNRNGETAKRRHDETANFLSKSLLRNSLHSTTKPKRSHFPITNGDSKEERVGKTDSQDFQQLCETYTHPWNNITRKYDLQSIEYTTYGEGSIQRDDFRWKKKKETSNIVRHHHVWKTTNSILEYGLCFSSSHNLDQNQKVASSIFYSSFIFDN